MGIDDNRRDEIKRWIEFYRDDIKFEEDSIALYRKVKSEHPDNEEIVKMCDDLISVSEKRIIDAKNNIKRRMKEL